jgi:SAM-dependent methyltransferase
VNNERLSALAPDLEYRPPGVWFARATGPISYPEHGNEAYARIEDASFWFRHRNRCIASVVRRWHSEGDFLDVGGGNGYVARGLQQAGVDCILLEPGLAGALIAKQRGITQVVCSRLEDAGFLTASVASAGLFDVLEHFEDDVAHLRLVHRILKPSGHLFLTVPAFQMLFSPEDRSVGHFRRYTLASLEARLLAAGFRSVFATYMFWPLPLPVFLFRTVPGYWGSRRVGSIEQATADHAPSKAGSWLVDRALDWEYAMVDRGRRLPVGSSCLVVATRA